MINALPFFFGPLGGPATGNGQTGGVALEQTKTPGNPSDNPFAKILRDQSEVFSLLKSLKLTVPTPSLGANGISEVPDTERAQDQAGLLPGDFSHVGQLTHVVTSPPAFLEGGADGVQTGITLKMPGLPFPAGNVPIQAPSVGKSLVDHSGNPMAMSSDLQHILRNAVKGNSLLAGPSDGEAATESTVESGKNVGKPLDRLASLVQVPSSPGGSPQEPIKSLVNQAFRDPLPFQETAARLEDDIVQSTQSRLKYVNGVSSVLSGESVHGKESSLAISSDLLIDSGLPSLGDRSKDVSEATGKIVGVDPHGGQGINNGMGGSTHSQGGFQQSSSSLLTGSGVRMAEERVPELPTPVLQRLQMDVQLSEANRIQIDVGVQHRQVYAGLLMDQATLKNLAIQFVPQLEEQLAQSDMDLQEFSAEVRDRHREPESGNRSNGSVMPHEHRGTTIVEGASELLHNSVKHAVAVGLHLVA